MFCGVVFSGLFNPVTWVTPWGLSNCSPLFVWQACSQALAVDSGFLANSGFSSFWMEGMKPPLYGQWGSLFWWVGVFYVREGDGTAIPPDMGVLPISLFPCLALSTMTQFRWVVVFFLGFTVCQHQWALMSFPPLHVHAPSEVHGHITLPKVFTHFQWTLQWTFTAKVITSCLSTPGKLCW